MRNQIKTVIFLLFLILIFSAAGFLFSTSRGVLVGLCVGIFASLCAYWYADRFILSMHKAQEIYPGDSMGLHEMSQRLAIRARVPMPRLYIIPDNSSNAFAVGRNQHQASIAVTQGIMASLNYAELEAVFAHEFAHIKRGDIVSNSVAALFGAVILLGTFSGPMKKTSGMRVILMATLAPIAAVVIRFLVSSRIECKADLLATQTSTSPDVLATALRKIYTQNSKLPLGFANPAFGHLYIVNPFANRVLLGTVIGMFEHRSMPDERIAILLNTR